jgi:hypothetical protein
MGVSVRLQIRVVSLRLLAIWGTPNVLSRHFLERPIEFTEDITHCLIELTLEQIEAAVHISRQEHQFIVHLVGGRLGH